VARRKASAERNRAESKQLLETVERKIDSGALPFHFAVDALSDYINAKLRGPRNAVRYHNESERLKTGQIGNRYTPTQEQFDSKLEEDTGISSDAQARELFNSIQQYVSGAGK
jgi:hypothetical protein